MLRYKMQCVMLAMVTGLFVSSVFSAETWRLGGKGQWKAVSAEDKYLLAVAEIKKLVNIGETEAVGQAVDKLKKDFPEITGPDLDAFMKAEMLFCEGKFTKAVRSYDRFLAKFPASELYEAALDRQFSIATAFLGGQKKRVLGVFMMSRYAEGIKIMEGISDRAGNAPIGIKAAVAVAQNYEKREKFTDAYHKWSDISSRWPIHEVGKESLLGMARCKHAAYKGPKFDVSNLISAKSYYENFRLRYPKDAERIDIDKILKQIDEQMAYKEFLAGEYYQKAGNEQSAALYYQMVLNNWPESTVAEMAKQRMDNKASDKDLQNEKGKKWKEDIARKLEELLL